MFSLRLNFVEIGSILARISESCMTYHHKGWMKKCLNPSLQDIMILIRKFLQYDLVWPGQLTPEDQRDIFHAT